VFDGVLGQNSSQSNLYEVSMRRLVMDFLNGYNATSIVYGQTGSGKSYSMFGENEASINTLADRKRGLVPRACTEIFQAIADREKLGIVCTLGVTYVEIYGDYVADLLKNGERVGHSQVASQQFVLAGAAERPVTSMEDVAEILRIGDAQKRRAATAMNDRSSRAHVLFMLTLNQTRYEKPRGSSSSVSQACSTTRTSRLFLADLGGSEQVKKSKVEAGGHRMGINDQFSVGFEMAQHMREAVYINGGLLALKKVIEALNNRFLHVPYNDNKLTMLLKSGLGGNCKTSIIVCANMDPQHASETVASLRFGERCSLIETEARNNANLLAAVLRDLDNRINILEQQIKDKERWELTEETRTDDLAEEGTVEAVLKYEVKKVYVPVGAETERIEMEKLLKQRAKVL
jgi:kinesin family protein 5